MCSIIGAIFKTNLTDAHKLFINHLLLKSEERGRDGIGVSLIGKHVSYKVCRPQLDDTFNNEFEELFDGLKDLKWDGIKVCIGNLRAEPTTEYVQQKAEGDQQPYYLGTLNIVHNGTIANDKELRTYQYNTTIDSAAIVEHWYNTGGNFEAFETTIKSIIGSFAILAHNSEDVNKIYFACNYRPIWYVDLPHGIYFASSNTYFPEGCNPKLIPPYSYGYFTNEGSLVINSLLTPTGRDRSLVVCSGGLDSVVAATVAQRELNHEVTLLHFSYGSRAETKELESIRLVAAELAVDYIVLPIPYYKKEDSPLLNRDCKIAGGEDGAEFAHEWVPARNLLMLSIAVTFAEANKYDHIILGNNLEEAGAYPDNEPEFINQLNNVLPFAVGPGKKVDILMPVGNLMKHEIVKLGIKCGAPLHATWSCYKSGEKHCGVCGPCHMRKIAFTINNTPEVIEYESPSS